VPYFLAALYDLDSGARASLAAEQQRVKAGGPTRVPKELREKLKRSRAARPLLRDLEAEVRRFVEEWNEKQRRRERAGLGDVDSLDEDGDEAIVFVGRGGAMADMPPSPKAKHGKRDRRSGAGEPEKRADSDSDSDVFEELAPGDSLHVARDRLVFAGLATDQTAAFARFLVHSIGAYYGLRTWTVAGGSPPRRAAYVGIEGAALAPAKMQAGRRRPAGLLVSMPRPLWGMV